MLIDSRTGRVFLPCGKDIASDFGRRQFLASALSESAEPWVAHGPYGSFRLPGGSVRGHEMNVLLFFYDEAVTMAQFGFNFYSPEANGWDSWSPEVEAQAKAFQEELLYADLGEPHIMSAPVGALQSGPAEMRRWAYSWGEVSSLSDPENGSAYVLVEYAGRREQAYADYQRWKARGARRDALRQRPSGLRSFLSGLIGR